MSPEKRCKHPFLQDNKLLNNQHFKQNLINSEKKHHDKTSKLLYKTVNLPKNVPETEKKYIFETKNISRANLTYWEGMQFRPAFYTLCRPYIVPRKSFLYMGLQSYGARFSRYIESN